MTAPMIAWSRGASKLDADPEQRLSPDFDAFVRALEVDRTPTKGLAYFAAPFSSNGNGRAHRGKETVQPVEFLIHKPIFTGSACFDSSSMD